MVLSKSVKAIEIVSNDLCPIISSLKVNLASTVYYTSFGGESISFSGLTQDNFIHLPFLVFTRCFGTQTCVKLIAFIKWISKNRSLQIKGELGIFGIVKGEAPTKFKNPYPKQVQCLSDDKSAQV